MNRHTDYMDLAPLYSLGSLETADVHVFRTHLGQGCGRCQSVVSTYDNVASLLAWLVQIPPSELARRRMHRRVQTDI